MNDSGSAHLAVAPMDPSALTSFQLAEIADQAQHPCPGGTEDFVHFTEDPLAGSHAYTYATCGVEQHGLLEETSQVIKIPETYAEAMESLQREEWKGACGNEMDSLRKHHVYTLVPLNSVPKGEKILNTKYAFKKKLDGRFKAHLVVGGHRQEAGQDYGGATHQCAVSGAFAWYSPLPAKRDGQFTNWRSVG